MSEQPKDVPWWRNHPWMGRHPAAENRNKFPLEELLKYNNKHVAWFPDGSGIRDADEDGEALIERIKASVFVKRREQSESEGGDEDYRDQWETQMG